MLLPHAARRRKARVVVDVTRLVQTEQGAYFGTDESLQAREEGTRELLEKLAQDLARQ